MSPARASALALVAALVLGANLAAAQAPSGPAAPGAVAGAPAGAPGDGGAATPRPSLPPPDLVPALRLVSPPLDKPAVPLPPIELPPSPQPFPPLPPPAVVSDLALRPSAPMSPPRALACNPLGSVFGVASEQLECGRAKYQRAELEPALAEFQAVMQKSGDRDLVREARYWAAESLLRLGRRADVASHFEIVAKEDPGSDIGLYSRHELAWVLLERGEAARALEVFQSFLRGRVVPELVPIARHGRALSFHALQRYPEARDEWTSLLNTSLPRPLAAEASYWLGDSLGRLGRSRGGGATAAGVHRRGPADPHRERPHAARLVAARGGSAAGGGEDVSRAAGRLSAHRRGALGAGGPRARPPRPRRLRGGARGGAAAAVLGKTGGPNRLAGAAHAPAAGAPCGGQESPRGSAAAAYRAAGHAARREPARLRAGAQWRVAAAGGSGHRRSRPLRRRPPGRGARRLRRTLPACASPRSISRRGSSPRPAPPRRACSAGRRRPRSARRRC